MVFLTAFTLLFLVANISYSFAGEGVVLIKGVEIEANSLNIVVEMDIDKGSRGDHIHFYLDGKNLGVVRSTKYMIKGLAKGKHNVAARLASKSHVELGPTGNFEITVR